MATCATPNATPLQTLDPPPLDILNRAKPDDPVVATTNDRHWTAEPILAAKPATAAASHKSVCKKQTHRLAAPLTAPAASSRHFYTGGSPIVSIQMIKTKICADFKHNRCNRKDNCPYAHGNEEMRALPDLRKTRMCMLHIAGKCAKLDCNYAHSSEELRFTCDFPQYKTELCRFHAAEGGRGCKYGAKCPYAHTTEELRKYVETVQSSPSKVPLAVPVAASLEIPTYSSTTPIDTTTDDSYDDADSSQTTCKVPCAISETSQDEEAQVTLSLPKLASRRKRTVTVDPMEEETFHQTESLDEKLAKVPFFADAAAVPVPNSPLLSSEAAALLPPHESCTMAYSRMDSMDVHSLVVALQKLLNTDDASRALKFIFTLLASNSASQDTSPSFTLKESVELERLMCYPMQTSPQRLPTPITQRALGPPPGFENVRNSYQSSHFLAERTPRTVETIGELSQQQPSRRNRFRIRETVF